MLLSILSILALYCNSHFMDFVMYIVMKVSEKGHVITFICLCHFYYDIP